MRKDLKDLREQKELLMLGMNGVPLDSKEYAQMMSQYKLMVETEETIKKGKSERGVLSTVLKVGSFVVTAAGVILVPQLLAEKSYQAEKDMSLKNGTIWNLIGKNFGPKDKTV